MTIVVMAIAGSMGAMTRYLISGAVQTYGLVTMLNLQSIVHGLLIPPRYWSQLRQFNRLAL